MLFRGVVTETVWSSVTLFVRHRGSWCLPSLALCSAFPWAHIRKVLHCARRSARPGWERPMVCLQSSCLDHSTACNIHKVNRCFQNKTWGFFFFTFQDRVSLCSPAWSWTLQPSYFSFLSAEVTGVQHHTCQVGPVWKHSAHWDIYLGLWPGQPLSLCKNCMWGPARQSRSVWLDLVFSPDFHQGTPL